MTLPGGCQRVEMSRSPKNVVQGVPYIYQGWEVKSLLTLKHLPRPSPPNPDQVSIKNCKQLFSQPKITTQKIAKYSTDIISAVGVAFFSVVNASRCEKVVHSFWYRPRYFRWNTMECERDSLSGVFSGAKETHWERVSHTLKGHPGCLIPRHHFLL